MNNRFSSGCHLTVFVLTFLILSPTENAFAQTFVGDQNDIKIILKNIDDFSRFYMKLDYESIVNAYTEDAVIMPPGADIISGREAIRKQWTLPIGVKIPYHKISPVEIKIVGEYAYDLGYYEGRTMQKDGNEMSWKGKYLIVWKKVNNQWKIYADAWNRIN